MFRLHIDIPIVPPEYDGKPPTDKQSECRDYANQIMEKVIQILREDVFVVQNINYRLGNDEDRGTPNYLVINENGHCSNKKSRWER